MQILCRPRLAKLSPRSHRSPAPVLQCVAVWYSMLQCVAACYSVLQCGTACCSVLQRVAVCCSVLQCVAVSQSQRLHGSLARVF